MTSMTVGEALNDPRTQLGKAAVQLTDERNQRIAAAQKIAAAEGVTLEQALARIWNAA